MFRKAVGVLHSCKQDNTSWGLVLSRTFGTRTMLGLCRCCVRFRAEATDEMPICFTERTLIQGHVFGLGLGLVFLPLLPYDGGLVHTDSWKGFDL